MQSAKKEGRATDAINIIKDKNFQTSSILNIFIGIFALSIIVGTLKLFHSMNEIADENREVVKLKSELSFIENEIRAKTELKDKLILDSSVVETAARRLGMSRKGESGFYFID
ncbi:hypothetical protein AGMMS49938_07370 [Fibrobacterales bacterium]|nr:hypothetical protein AGMMS49938_07370 [Fibrobacterales bacterium]